MLLPCFTAEQKLKNLCIHPHFWGVFLFLIYSRAEKMRLSEGRVMLASTMLSDSIFAEGNPQSSRRVNLIMH